MGKETALTENGEMKTILTVNVIMLPGAGFD